MPYVPSGGGGLATEEIITLGAGITEVSFEFPVGTYTKLIVDSKRIGNHQFKIESEKDSVISALMFNGARHRSNARSKLDANNLSNVTGASLVSVVLDTNYGGNSARSPKGTIEVWCRSKGSGFYDAMVVATFYDEGQFEHWAQYLTTLADGEVFGLNLNWSLAADGTKIIKQEYVL